MDQSQLAYAACSPANASCARPIPGRVVSERLPQQGVGLTRFLCGSGEADDNANWTQGRVVHGGLVVVGGLQWALRHPGSQMGQAAKKDRIARECEAEPRSDNKSLNADFTPPWAVARTSNGPGKFAREQLGSQGDERGAVKEGFTVGAHGTSVSQGHVQEMGVDPEQDWPGKGGGGLSKKGGKSVKHEMGLLGVCRHKRNGRYEAYIWVPGTRRQVYLGGFATAAQAAIAHDIVALKVKKTPLVTNFPANLYAAHKDWIHSNKLPNVIAHIKRQSRSSNQDHYKFRGVSLNSSGHFEPCVDVGTNHHAHLGTHGGGEATVRQYDRPIILMKGGPAATKVSVGGIHKLIRRAAQEK